MKAACILVIALAATPWATARAQPMSRPPELKPPEVSEPPPAPQLPPGVLEGHALPAQRQSAASPGGKGANDVCLTCWFPRAPDMLAVRNATQSAAWVSIYDSDMPAGGACIGPRDEVVLGVPRGGKLRAQATRDGACTQPSDACDASLDLLPGAKGVELRRGRNGCMLQATNGGVLKRPISNNLKVVNTSPTLWLWISRYDWGSEPITGFSRRNIVETTCLAPGKSVDYTITRNTYYDGGARKFESGIRGEFVQANCRHPRPCDTQLVNMEWWSDSRGKTWYIHYDPQRRMPTRFPPPAFRPCGGTWTPNG
jgi:hypothetical protein